MASMTRPYAFLGLLLLLQQGCVHCTDGSFLHETNITEHWASQRVGNSSSHVARNGWAAMHRKMGAFQSSQPTNISVAQGHISNDKIPRFEVQITNTCTVRLCIISNIVVKCGHYSSANFLNPKVFRRLDVSVGTCLTNDGRSIQLARAPRSRMLDVSILHPFFSVRSSFTTLSLCTKRSIVFSIVDKAARSRVTVLYSCFLTRYCYSVVD